MCPRCATINAYTGPVNISIEAPKVLCRSRLTPALIGELHGRAIAPHDIVSWLEIPPEELAMRKPVIAALALLGVVAGSAGAQYNPYGPQQNVSLATILSGGWTQCYEATMAVPLGNDASSVLTPCQGQNIMMAGRYTGAADFLVLAAGLRSDVIQDVGNGVDAHHAVNGSEWYFSPGWSWGFAPLGATTYRYECDTNDLSDPLRMCLHTLDVGGWRIGTNYYLNGSTDFEKVFFVNDAILGPVVPEPSTVVLLGTGIVGLMGFVRRHRKFTA